MPLIPNVNNRYPLLTHSITKIDHADKKTDKDLIKQLLNIESSADKTIAISNKEGNMEINILYSKKKFCIPLLFSVSKQKKITLSSQSCKGIMLTPSKDLNNKTGVKINLITDQPFG